MDDVRRHGRVRWDEQTWLVHIAPDSVYTGIKQCLVLLSPPSARVWVREIGNCTDPPPDEILAVVPFWCLAVELPCFSSGVDRVVGGDLDPRLDTPDGAATRPSHL